MHASKIGIGCALFPSLAAVPERSKIDHHDGVLFSRFPMSKHNAQ